MQNQNLNFIDINLNKIVTIGEDVCVVLTDGLVDKNIYLENFENTLLSYHFTKYSEFSYIKTIYQIFTSFIKSSGYTFNECLISEYKDSIGYCKIKLDKNQQSIFFSTSIADGIIISLIENVPLKCDILSWEELDEFVEEGDDYIEFNQNF